MQHCRDLVERERRRDGEPERQRERERGVREIISEREGESERHAHTKPST